MTDYCMVCSNGGKLIELSERITELADERNSLREVLLQVMEFGESFACKSTVRGGYDDCDCDGCIVYRSMNGKLNGR